MRRNKFHNVKTNGFDSRKEYNRSIELEALEKMGAISNLQRQVWYELIPKQGKLRAAYYVSDFTFVCDGKEVVEDVKSPITRKLPVYALKKKLMKWVHNIDIKET